MKKTYESPSVEKIAFQYRDQVVVASGTVSGVCSEIYDSNSGALGSTCFTGKYSGDKTYAQ